MSDKQRRVELRTERRQAIKANKSLKQLRAEKEQAKSSMQEGLNRGNKKS